MKLLIAYVKPEVFTDVKRALLANDITRFSVTNAVGSGAEKGLHENYRGADVEIDLLKKVRIEIALNDAFVDRALDIILKHATTHYPDQSGDHGDGKIFVLPVEQCIRIRTGERGGDAIGD
ncbi:MAG: P-II family nitrogen regulator [Planctomycetota bacterium]